LRVGNTRADRLANEATDPEKVSAATKQQQKDEATRAAHQAKLIKAEQLSLERHTLYRKLRTHAAAKGMSIHMLRATLKILAQEFALPHDLFGSVYPFDSRDDDAVMAFIDEADGPTVMLMLMDLIVGESLTVQYWNHDDEPGTGYAAVQSLAHIEGIQVTAADLAIAGIDVASLNNPTDVAGVIAENIEYLAEVASHIIDKAPHHVGSVQAAANQLGYFYGDGGWHKASPETLERPAEAVASSAALEPAQAEAPAGRQKLKLKLKPKVESVQEGQAGPIIKTKKTRTVTPQPNDGLPADMEYPNE